jgi:hypothetical protein
MGQVFALAKQFVEMPPGEIEKLLESPIHEVRAGGLSIMDKQARRKRTPEGALRALPAAHRQHQQLGPGRRERSPPNWRTTAAQAPERASPSIRMGRPRSC